MITNVHWISLINSPTLINFLPISPDTTHYHKRQLRGMFPSRNTTRWAHEAAFLRPCRVGGGGWACRRRDMEGWGGGEPLLSKHLRRIRHRNQVCPESHSCDCSLSFPHAAKDKQSSRTPGNTAMSFSGGDYFVPPQWLRGTTRAFQARERRWKPLTEASGSFRRVGNRCPVVGGARRETWRTGLWS